MKKAKRKISLKVPFVTRLEGEGSLELSARGDRIDKLHLAIFEPPRLFEKFLEGRGYQEVPDLNARICGICPMAYQLTSIQAMEQLFGITLPTQLVQLRRLMNLGEWVQSHALHIHFLAAPDFLGFDHALAMAKLYPEVLKRGMQLQEAGNALMTLLGGRSVHPVGLQVGGFGRLPDVERWDQVRRLVGQALPAAEQLVRWTAGLTLPDYSHDFTWVSLTEPDAYAINGGRLTSSNGLSLDYDDYADHFAEHQEPHSTALYSLLDGKNYLVGPLARMNNNFGRLPAEVKALAGDCGLDFPSRNMFTSIQARALEIYWALFEASRLLAMDCPTGEASLPVTPRAGECCFCTEAPRGMIYHHYRLDEQGRVLSCTIIPPTSQNQARIEQDLKTSVTRFGLSHSDLELKLFCERLIRNYDPCISCSTHFLQFKIRRG
ncbi:coenzyme F420-reducing hydrogenase alpha subunit [Oceanisphaera litoralis]|uniref:Ni/Fe hydrogenase subunit alpha n=1 Tax=Oceanisphaera litoralis TaxID=225144 RepID=UPI001959D2A7|nr:Ni/Fe hydrogenase subunit alpha [Oceanisphaera litoralis]MBM7457098.1 coenzyme F420-reducing hydrogenase alpha subunit [Oceanisphaera litoralis]